MLVWRAYILVKQPPCSYQAGAPGFFPAQVVFQNFFRLYNSDHHPISFGHDSPLAVMKTGEEIVGYGEEVPRDVAWKMPRGASLTCRMVSPDCQGDWIWKRLVRYTSAVAERFPQRSNWKGKASVMMDCDSPWAETWQSKRGACAWGWASRGPDRLRPCFNHHKLCHAFLAIMDWSHLDCETKQSFPLMSYSYGVFCVIYTKMTNTACQQYSLKFGLSPSTPLTSWGTFELHRTSVSPSVKIVIVILAL